MYECCVCHQHARTTLSAVLRHIREVHPYFANAITCGLNGCAATPSSFEALKKHIYRYHRELLNIPDDDSNTPSAPNPTVDENCEEEGSLEHHDADDSAEASLSTPSSAMLGAKFILKTRDGKGLTQTDTDGIVHDVKVVLQNTVESLEQSVLQKVNELQVITEDNIEELKAIFSDERVLNPFKDLETSHKQEKFIQENFNYVVSCNEIWDGGGGGGGGGKGDFP